MNTNKQGGTVVDERLKEMLEVNKKQKEFYESMQEYMNTENAEGDSFINRGWSRVRARFHQSMAEFGLYDDLSRLHTEWVGDLTGRKVFDLGCYDGYPGTIKMAVEAEEYYGIDLSEPAINVLNKKLKEAGAPNAKAESVDFLSPEFQEKHKNKWDVVYAHAVAHHFEHFELFLENVKNIMKDDGIVVTYDPMQTYTPFRLLRNLYRPFQADADWEWPFRKSNFEAIQKHFKIDKMHGSMGKAKWAIPVYMMNKKKGKELGMKWHAQDMERSQKRGPDLWKCMHVTMVWKKK